MIRVISTAALILSLACLPGCGLGSLGGGESALERGVRHYENGHYDLAITALTEAIRLDPKDADAYHCRGLAYHEKKEYAKAVADQSDAIRVDTTGEVNDCYIARGHAHRKLKKYKDALLDFQDAVKRDGDDPDAHNELAWFLATCPDDASRDGRRALKHAQRACELDVTAIHWDTLAAAHAEVGDFAEAVKWQEKALASPDEGIEADLAGAKKRLKLYKEGKPWREE